MPRREKQYRVAEVNPTDHPAFVESPRCRTCAGNAICPRSLTLTSPVGAIEPHNATSPFALYYSRVTEACAVTFWSRVPPARFIRAPTSASRCSGLHPNIGKNNAKALRNTARSSSVAFAALGVVGQTFQPHVVLLRIGPKSRPAEYGLPTEEERALGNLVSGRGSAEATSLSRYQKVEPALNTRRSRYKSRPSGTFLAMTFH